MAKASQGMDVGKMAADGFGQMMNSMDFFKRAWSGLATPFTPTVNVEEIDKRITDLRAVEQWLSLNQNLLRSTIQGLEIQRGTLDAINTVTSSFGNAMKPSDDSMAQSVARHAAAAAQKSVEPPAPAASAAKPGNLFGSFDWSPFGMPSSMLPGFHTASPSRIGSGSEEADGAASDAGTTAASGAASGAGAAQTSGTGADERAAAGASGERASGGGSTGVGAPAAADAGAGGDASTGGATGAGGASPPPGMNPLAWWQMLQDNFRQIAQAATGDGSQASPFGLAGALPTAGGKIGGSSGSGGEAGSRGSKTGGRTGKAAGGATALGGTGSSSRSGTTARKKKAEDGAGGVGGGSAAAGATASAGKRSRRKAGSAKDSG